MELPDDAVQFSIAGHDSVMILNVTKYHIQRAEPLNCEKCPLALAIKSLLKPGYSVYVSEGIEISDNHGARKYFSPRTAKMDKFIEQFDWYSKAKPTSFRCPAIPKELLKKKYASTN